MRLTAKFALILMIPILALAASYWFASQALLALAQGQVEQEAKLIMKAAIAARNYTDLEIKPLIEKLTDPATAPPAAPPAVNARREFIKPTVPAYAARRIRELMFEGDKQFDGYQYKEAVPDPTDQKDKADAKEQELIDSLPLELNNDTEPRKDEFERNNKEVLCYYQPIKMKASCVECHDTREKASSPDFIQKNGDMLAAYGEKIGGFGWKKEEGSIIGARIVYVPKEKPHQIARDAVRNIGLVLLGSSLLMVLCLWFVVNQLVLRPVARLSQMAEQISQGRLSSTELPVSGKDEIAELTKAFNRMNRSLYKAVKRLQGS